MCRWCSTPLAHGAVVCHKCQRSQKRIIEYLRYWAPIVGLLAVFSSGLNYIYPSISDWVRSYLHPSIEMTYLATETTDSIISNVGPSDVFLTTLWVVPVAKELQEHRLHYPINKLLRHGTVLALDLESASTKYAKANPDLPPFRVLPIIPMNAIDKLEGLLRINDPNVTTAIYDEDNEIFKTAQEMLHQVEEAAQKRTTQLVDNKETVYSLQYACKLDFVHRYSEDLSPYIFPCKGMYAIRSEIAKLLGTEGTRTVGEAR